MTPYTPHSRKSGKTEGPGILLANSLGTTMNMWAPQLELLEAHFQVVRFDTRGHGDSEAPAAPYHFADLIADAFSVMDAHGLATATVMGCSLGSMTALGMGLQNPDRIDGILCTAARADAPPPFKQSWDDRIAIMEQNGIEGLWAGSLGNWLTPAFRDSAPDTVAALHTDFLKTRPEGYRGCANALKGLDFFKNLSQMSVPVQFIAGSEDKGAAPETMRAMADATPGSVFDIIPDAGHIINVNKPEAFNAVVARFLSLNS